VSIKPPDAAGRRTTAASGAGAAQPDAPSVARHHNWPLYLFLFLLRYFVQGIAMTGLK